MGRPLARPRRRSRHRALEHHGPRDHPRGTAQRLVRRARDGGLRGVRRLGRAVHARGGRAPHRRPGRRDPRDRARLRARRPGDDLLDARDHRAPQRGRQRPRAHQPRPALRARGALRLGAQPAPRAEQRPGRRRHGRHPQQASGLPGHRARPRRARTVRGRLGDADPAGVRLASDADVPRDGPRGAPDPLRDRREPGAVGGRRQPRPQAARCARPAGRPGHRDDEDGGDGRRRPSRHRLLVRGGRDRDEQRAPRPARAQGARPAGRRARRHVDPHRARAAPRSRLGTADGRGDLGRVPLALADARWDAVRPAGGAARAAVAVPGRGAPRLAVPPRAPLGRSRRRAARPVQRRRGEAAVRGARRRLPHPAHDRETPRVVQHGRAVEPVPLAAPPRRVPGPLAGGRRAPRDRRRRDRARVVEARLGRGARADRSLPPGRARLHDVPLPGRGRRQPADDRRHRPEVGYGRVQGGCGPRGQARAVGTRAERGPPRAHRGDI